MSNRLYYNNLEGLRAPNIGYEYSEEEEKEILKCMDDIPYFMSNYVKIISVDKGLVNFTPYPYQIEMLKKMDEHNRFVVLAPRQCGKCVIGDTTIRIRNKKTKKIKTVTLEEFYNMSKK